MSKRQHQRQMDRARQKRRADRFEKRRRRARIVAVTAVVALVLSVFAAVLINALEREPDPAEPGAEELGADEEPRCPDPEDAPEVDAQQYDEPPPMEIDEDATYAATMETTCGTIVLELDAAGAPMATNNFVFLAREGFYDGVGFHRIIPDFMIQGGDPEGTGAGGPGYAFEDELGPAREHFEAERQRLLGQLEEQGDLEPEGDVDPEEVPGGYPRGVLAMANSGPDTNGSQFFITHGDPAILPGPDYTLFGEVVEGMDVVDLIATEPAQSDQALEPVRIISIDIDER